METKETPQCELRSHSGSQHEVLVKIFGSSLSIWDGHGDMKCPTKTRRTPQFAHVQLAFAEAHMGRQV